MSLRPELGLGRRKVGQDCWGWDRTVGGPPVVGAPLRQGPHGAVATLTVTVPAPPRLVRVLTYPGPPEGRKTGIPGPRWSSIYSRGSKDPGDGRSV